MTRAPSGRRSLGRAAVGAVLGVLVFAARPVPARASRAIDLYRASVPAGTPQSEAQAGMRIVLVRATGSLDAPADPALAPLISGASADVLSISSPQDGTVRVNFDGSRVAQQIAAAHRSVWDARRPFVIVTLSPVPTGSADNAVRQNLESVASLRGLPVALVPLAVTDASGQPLSDTALLNAAERFGADALLLGRATESGSTSAGSTSAVAAASSMWHWTLVTAVSSHEWNGTLADGINEATDALAQAQGGSLSAGVQAANVAVTGVQTLADYAAVERMLAGLPGVQSSGLIAARGATATFRVLIRGGAPAVESALAHATRLERAGMSTAPLTYRLQP